MASARSWILGVGCLVVLVVAAVVGLTMWGLASPSLPGDIILTLRLDGPIEELTADDPFQELLGEGAISMRKVREALLGAAEDDRVRGVVVRIDSFGGGLAYAQEVRALLQRVRAAGKWTAAHMDTVGEFSSGNLEYYVASACDELSLNPLGDVNLIGFAVRSPFIRGTFDKLGITVEFPGRGRYKTARFMYTEREFTPEQEEMMRWLIGSMMDQLVEDVARSRGLEVAEVRNLVDRAPFLGSEAVEVGLIDEIEDRISFVERMREREDDADLVTAASYVKRRNSSIGGPKVAVVTAVGAIMRGESRRDLNPLLGGVIMGSDTIARAFDEVRKANGIKAVVFRIDSPGGSAVASEVIRQAMARTAEEIPVVVSMANVAGSGGYWITCGAQKIVADPATITGSIGVFAGHLNTTDFWNDKLGVTFGRLDFGEHAGMYGDLTDWTDEERRIVDHLLDRIYNAFLERVAESRGMTVDEVHQVGEGRVFSGVQAVERGLVDVAGSFDVALAEAKSLAGIDPETEVKLVDYPRPIPLWKQLLGKSRHEELRVEDVARLLDEWARTGVDTPGAVWLPPLEIQ